VASISKDTLPRAKQAHDLKQ